MTALVKIEHVYPNYDKDIIVTELDGPHRQHGQSHVVKPGQFVELFVYSTHSILIEEEK